MGVDELAEAVVSCVSSVNFVERGVVWGLMCDEDDIVLWYGRVCDERFECFGCEAESFAAIPEEVVVVDIEDLLVEVCDVV